LGGSTQEGEEDEKSRTGGWAAPRWFGKKGQVFLMPISPSKEGGWQVRTLTSKLNCKLRTTTKKDILFFVLWRRKRGEKGQSIERGKEHP